MASASRPLFASRANPGNGLQALGGGPALRTGRLLLGQGLVSTSRGVEAVIGHTVAVVQMTPDPNALPGATSNHCYFCWYVLSKALVAIPSPKTGCISLPILDQPWMPPE